LAVPALNDGAMTTTMSKTEIAELFGVSTRTVTDLAKRNIFIREVREVLTKIGGGVQKTETVDHERRN
jgi:hypothetical protein